MPFRFQKSGEAWQEFGQSQVRPANDITLPGTIWSEKDKMMT